ncbi:hypothetical protein PPTS312_44240 [Pseudomonas putida]|uniref:Uncharacterized protein n=1 Tax=Pseudomonas putida TaxID=303 RepID=A0A7U6M672_PSEPU|nr:hypothetical protein PPTS312_44240 [Pseudomonas putida]
MPFGDGALERGVIEWVIFDMHREALHFWIEARPLGYGPAFKGAIKLQTEIVVQPGGIMFLNTEL